MQRMMRYFRQFYAQCGKAVLLYLLLTIVHKILAFISPPTHAMADRRGDRGECERIFAHAGH